MKDWRKIHRNIFENEDLGILSSNAFQLFVAMIVYADDEGRIKAGAAYLRGKAFRYRDDVKIDDVRVYRDALTQAVGLQVYEVEGEKYAHLPNWFKWQGAKGGRSNRFTPSELPAPPKKTDSPNDGRPLADHWPTTGMPMAGLDKSRGEERRAEGARLRGEGYPIDIETLDTPPAPPAAPRGVGEAAGDQEQTGDKNDAPLKSPQLPEDNILAVAAAYCEARGTRFVNEAARAVYLRQKAMFYPARDLLALNDGRVDRAVLCVNDFAEHYRQAGKAGWTWTWLLEDFPKWDKPRRDYERQEKEELAESSAE